MKKNLIFAIAAMAAAVGFASCSGGYTERTTYYGYSRPDVVVAKKANDTVITRRTIAIDTLYDSRVDDPSSPGAATVTTTTKEVLVYEPSIFTEYSTDHSYYFYQRDYYDPEVLVSVNTGYYSGFSYHPTVWVSIGNSSPWYNPWFSPYYDPWYNPWYRPYYGYAGYWGWGWDNYYYHPYHNHHHHNSGFYTEHPIRDNSYSRNYAQNASGVKRVQRPGTAPASSTGGRVATQNTGSSRTSRVGQTPSGAAQSVDKPVRSSRSSSITNGIKNVGTEVKPSRDAKPATTVGSTPGNTQTTRVRKPTTEAVGTPATPAPAGTDKPIRIKKINPDNQAGTRNPNNSGVRSQQNGRGTREAKPATGNTEQKRENNSGVKREESRPQQQAQPKREEPRREEQPKREEQPRQERRQESERPAPRMERSAPSPSPSPSSSPSRGSGSGSGSSSGGSRRR